MLPRSPGGARLRAPAAALRSRRTSCAFTLAVCAFTLVELLVVVAIISLLAAILFPVFARAREKGRQTACVSNLKQIALAWQMYATDYDEIVCPSYFLDGPTERGWDFTLKGTVASPGLLASYTVSGALHQCPDFYGSAFGRPYTGYAYNATYLGGDDYRQGTPACFYPASPLSQIPFPAQTAAFADGGWGITSPKAENYLRAPSDTILYPGGLVDFRHDGRTEVAYADGHVHSSPAGFPYYPTYPRYGGLSADDSAYGLGMLPACKYASHPCL